MTAQPSCALILTSRLAQDSRRVCLFDADLLPGLDVRSEVVALDRPLAIEAHPSAGRAHSALRPPRLSRAPTKKSVAACSGGQVATDLGRGVGIVVGGDAIR